MVAVPLKMKFESYADRGVESAVELINRLSPGWSRGRAWELPRDAVSRRELAQEVEAKTSQRSVHLRGQAGEELIRLAADLRSIFELMARGRQERAAALVNSLLIRYQAAPQLAKHDGEAWHLHFHSQDKEAGRAVARAAVCVIALAVVIGRPRLSTEPSERRAPRKFPAVALSSVPKLTAQLLVRPKLTPTIWDRFRRVAGRSFPGLGAGGAPP